MRNGRNCHNTRLVRDTTNLITPLKISQSVTATAIKREENLHRFLPPLQGKCAGYVSPNLYIYIFLILIQIQYINPGKLILIIFCQKNFDKLNISL